MASINNVNLGVLEQIAKEGKTDKSKVKRQQKIEGEWLLTEGGPQFRADISFEGGKTTLESDQPRTLGGGGSRPGPLHYCFFGLLSCYTATYATVAAQMGVKLKKLSSKVEGDLNFSKVFGLGEEAMMEQVRVTIQVEADAPKAKLEEIEKTAYQKCPAVYALTQMVDLRTQVLIK